MGAAESSGAAASVLDLAHDAVPGGRRFWPSWRGNIRDVDATEAGAKEV
jgi:hypothetical protein